MNRPPALLLLLPLVSSGCGRDLAAPAPALPAVEVAAVGAPSATDAIRAPGIVSRRLETPLAFRTGGVVDEVRVRDGAAVKRGAVLAALALDEIDARVRQARATVDKARRDLERAENLLADRVATLEQVQDARTGVEQAEAALEIAAFQRERSVIVAPGDGVVLRRLVEPGQEIASGSAALVFGSAAEGWVVRAGLSQSDAVRVEAGDAAEVEFPGQAARVAASVTRLHPAADPVTRTTTVELELRAVPDGVRSGDVGTVAIRRAADRARVSVPLSALVEGTGNDGWVFLLDPVSSTVRRTAVRTAGIAGDRALLDTPLAPDVLVVIVGAEYLRDGASVRVVRGGGAR